MWLMCLPIKTYYAAKFQKNCYSGSWDISLRKFWQNWPKITHLLQKKIFFENFFNMTFI